MRPEIWNSLIQLAFGFVLAIPTLYFQFQMFFVNRTDRRVSNHLRINMFMWVVASIFNLIYTGYFLLFFRGEGTVYRVKIVSIIGTTYFTVLTSVSCSVLFLLVDRCLILALPLVYEKSIKKSFEMFCVVAVIGNFLIVFGSHLATGLAPGEFTQCLSAGCLPNPNRNVVSIAAKFVYGFCNSLIALIFAVMFFRFNRKQMLKNSTTKRANFTACAAIVSELLCSVLPNFIILCAFYLQLSVIQKLGPFVNTMSALDGFCVTISYIKILGWDIQFSGWLKSNNTQKTISIVPT